MVDCIHRCSAGPAWKDAVGRLRRIESDDRAFVVAAPNTERNLVRATAAGLYVRYMVTCNELTKCHDYIIQPQLRIFIKNVLTCTFGRIFELKKILINEDLSIYTPIIEELNNMKITYDEFELRIPRFFRNERRLFLDDMDNKINEINNRIVMEENNDLLSEIQNENIEIEDVKLSSASLESSESQFDVEKFVFDVQPVPKFHKITSEDNSKELAIKFIQKHIRAVKDRVTVNELISARITRNNIISGKYKQPSKEKGREAAVKIQRYWRYYRLMVQTKARKLRRHILLGMHITSEKLNFNINYELEDTIQIQQTEADFEYRKVITKLEENFVQRDKHEIIEEIEDELRAYVWKYFEMCHHLPTWPDSKPIMFSDDNNNVIGLPPIILSPAILKELNIPDIRYKSALKQRLPLGGSAIFQTGRWMTIEMAEILAMLIIEFENKPAKERKELTKQLVEKNKTEKEKNLENAKTKEKLTAAIKILGVVLEPSELIEKFKDTFNEYDSNWALYDEVKNEPREDLIKSEIYSKAQLELRALVDETIKKELILLKMAYAQDLKKKYKEPKKKNTEKSKRKIKENKSELSPNEIFEELVKNNLIKKSVSSRFIDFQGEISLSACVLRNEPYYSDPPYGLGDIRQIIKELCVIGLIFEELRTLKNIKFSRSLLIAGPEKSGKSILINAICTETGSLKIELTLKNVSENYPELPKINQLVKNVIKLAKTYQPVVIEVDLADVPFYKSIPNDLKVYKPNLMQKLLIKLMKSLNKADRIIVIGKARSPWLTSKTKLSNIFETIVFTVPDDCTTFLFLNDLLMSYPVVSRTFPVTPLATMLAGYSRQMIADIVAKVMTTERVLTLRKHPLDPAEFVPVILEYPKQNPQQFEQYYKWYNKYVSIGVSKVLEMETKLTLNNKNTKN
ncbi:dynein regulatory complex protein 11-like, partial [Melanaphis sacchari]|uniref:dynein regulatory complex protein 11-like n=1 Tax=Melanaphis sacchari TaxID=742174 RepID=UPI000DC136B1